MTESESSYTPGTFGRLVARFGILACLGALGYGVLTHDAGRSSIAALAMTYGLPVVGLLGCIALLRLRPDRRDALGLAMAATVFALYLAEGAIRILEPATRADVQACLDAAGAEGLNNIAHRNCMLARQRGLPFDMRSPLQVMEELEANGDSPVPAVHPRRLLFRDDGWPVWPMAGVSRATTVYCNETGQFVVYEADEWGFRNPPGVFGGEGGVGLVGDSFTQGHCAAEDETIAGVVRREHPRTINVGQQGNGPLLGLATLKEYLSQERPRVVYWLFYEGNDLRNLAEEKRRPELLEYLTPGYSQGLRTRQAEVDDLWRGYIRNSRDSAIALRDREVVPVTGLRDSPLVRFALLTRVRDLISSATPDRTVREDHLEVADLLGRVLREAKREVESWGGRLVVVYLPTWSRFAEAGEDAPPRAQILEVVADAGVDVIDATERFAAHPDPVTLWPFSVYGHYTPEGYGIIGELILRDLESSSPELPE